MKQTLLDAMIKEHGIPKCPFEASLDRIVVYSVPEDKASRDTYVPGGLLVKPESKKAQEENETPRGIIVSAGLLAQDYLRGHGMGLGHMVWVARLSPWRYEFDRTSDGKVIEMLFLRAGDIVGSETLLGQVRAGKVTVELQPDGRHWYKYNDDAARPRFDPPSYVA